MDHASNTAPADLSGKSDYQRLMTALLHSMDEDVTNESVGGGGQSKALRRYTLEECMDRSRESWCMLSGHLGQWGQLSLTSNLLPDMLVIAQDFL